MDKKVLAEIKKRISKKAGFPVSFIGKGSLGGKAQGLIDIESVLQENFKLSESDEIEVSIPAMTVIRTDVFERFMDMNSLWEPALSSRDDAYIAHLFQKASLPVTILGDLRTISADADQPLAVRSSSLLEDSSDEPFAGVYATKMLPNNQQSLETRFSKLTEAIKFVYSSMFFADSREYFRIIGKDIRSERMALIIQEVVGNRYGNFFYPLISGVGRSYNHYPMREAGREDGVVNLALGLGKTIVDGGWSWLYCPRFPKSPPPYNSISELMQASQRKFWAVKMGFIPEFNPVSEIEFLEERELEEADKEGTLAKVCSTYDHVNDSLRPGTQLPGARLLNFAPVLKYNTIALNETVKKLLQICRDHYQNEVEIEFALKKTETGYHLGFLQVRAMQVHKSYNIVNIEKEEKESIFVASENVLGDGIKENVCDIILVKPENYNPRNNIEIAGEIASLNSRLISENRPYLLLGYGRWGSSDPWLGIPVTWSQIAGAVAIIEATLPSMNPDLSQGSHFFHNLVAFNIFYLSIREEQKKSIDWNWLKRQNIEENLRYVQHINLLKPLQIVVSSSTHQGVIFK